MKLKIKRCREDVVLPIVTEGNAGIDLRIITEDKGSVVFNPNEYKVVHTGIKLDIEEGYYVDVVPRSSIGIKKTLRLMNTIGVIDTSYKGEILLGLHNFGKEPVILDNNERVCQMIVRKVEDVVIEEAADIGTSDRGEGGIGSTGRF